MAERSIVQILLRASGGRQVSGETQKATRGLRTLDRAAAGAGRSFTAMRGAAVTAGAALGYGLYRGAKTSVMAFAEAEKVGAQTRAVLESTGHAAGQSARQIEDRANALSRMAGVDDEAIQSAQNMLLTFRDIRGQAFGPATEAALDMSSAFTAMGKSMTVQDAALQLGKALNDPTKGMTRLQRIGVTFTESQIEQAKALVDNGDLLGAQRIILRELNKEFGGSAKAAGKTTAGAMGRLQVSVENAQEAIGLGLAPAVGLAADKMDDLVQEAIPGLTRLSTKVSDVFGRDDLDLAGKIAVSARELRTAGEPVVEELVQGLKNAQLDDKLQDAIEWAAPKIADGAAAAAPRAASALVNAWLDYGVWGKLITAAFLANKMGGFAPFRTAGRSGGRAFGIAFAAAAGLQIVDWLSHTKFIHDISQTLANALTGTSPEEIQRQLQESARGIRRDARGVPGLVTGDPSTPGMTIRNPRRTTGAPIDLTKANGDASRRLRSAAGDHTTVINLTPTWKLDTAVLAKGNSKVVVRTRARDRR